MANVEARDPALAKELRSLTGGATGHLGGCSNFLEEGVYSPGEWKAMKSDRRSYSNRAFRRTVKAAGLDPSRITPHVMRHTAITRLVEAGTPLPTVQKISGHKSLAMVIRYTHVSDPHVDTAMQSLERSRRRNVA